MAARYLDAGRLKRAPLPSMNPSRPRLTGLRIVFFPLSKGCRRRRGFARQPSVVRRRPRFDVALRHAGGRGKLCQHQCESLLPPTVSKPVRPR